MQNKGRRNFTVYAASFFLIAYLLLLLGTTYVSQQELKQAAIEAVKVELEKRASALSYFYSERKNDIVTLGKNHSLGVFFSNQDLGMSMAYGLKASLLSVKNTFNQLVENKQINSSSIYLRAMFFEQKGQQLVDVGVASGMPAAWFKQSLLMQVETKLVAFQSNGKSHLLMIHPYLYKGIRRGTIIVEINHKDVVRQLIQLKDVSHSSYSVLVNEAGTHNDSISSELSNAPSLKVFDEPTSDNLSSYLKIPVPNSPFIVAAVHPENISTGFLSSPWYLLSLGLLALLVLYAVFVGIRTRTRGLILQDRYDASKKQNQLLAEEVSKRLDSEASLQTLIEAIPDMFWLKDLDGVYLNCNRKFERFFGAKKSDIVGKTDYHFVDQDLADSFRKHDKETIAQNETSTNEELVTFKDDGHKELLETIKTPFIDSKNNLIGVLGIARNITARKEAEEKLLYLSVHDPLTGLYNRRVLEERVKEEVNRAKRYNHPLSIFMLDVDHFKKINDTYGHSNGDKALRYLAEVLSFEIRTTDYAARYGGEEFVVILPDTLLPQAQELAERLRLTIAQSPIPSVDMQRLNMTISIGIASYPLHHESWAGLFKAADSAMYLAKKAGRNQIKTAVTN